MVWTVFSFAPDGLLHSVHVVAIGKSPSQIYDVRLNDDPLSDHRVNDLSYLVFLVEGPKGETVCSTLGTSCADARIQLHRQFAISIQEVSRAMCRAAPNSDLQV